MILGWVAMGWAQSPRPLEFSGRTLAFGKAPPDTLRIRNPNPGPIRCDSLVLLLESQSAGMFRLESTPRGQDRGPRLQLFMGYAQNLDPRTGEYRGVFTYGTGGATTPHFDLEFPGNQTLAFVWDGYDPCAVCKRSAAPVAADSLRFRLVFHDGPHSDTVRMIIDRRYTVGIGATRPGIIDRGESGAGEARDLLGRGMRAAGGTGPFRYRYFR